MTMIMNMHIVNNNNSSSSSSSSSMIAIIIHASPMHIIATVIRNGANVIERRRLSGCVYIMRSQYSCSMSQRDVKPFTNHINRGMSYNVTYHTVQYMTIYDSIACGCIEICSMRARTLASEATRSCISSQGSWHALLDSEVV